MTRRNSARGTAAALLFLLLAAPPLAPGPAAADIYRWEDDAGTIHFTDDLSTVPREFRSKARPIVRQGPVVLPASPEAPPPGRPAEPSVPAPGEAREEPPAALSSEIEQLRAKIEAKEKLIRQVDEKRSLATNPLRNRLVDPSDMDLYEKYRAELPRDRERLKELESRLNPAR